ncbi:MAG: type IV CRISPR-associated protein Csf2 [Rhodocyclaceae bacterium]|nr:type IV CRISPR-associated protein Csf2 [Opitutaceae bacterium]MCL4682854.1 type IV CRISPR-associated protein Csf2 [Rhodocyclaceae bacterium]
MNTNSIEVALSLTAPMHVAYPDNYVKSEGLSKTITQTITVGDKKMSLPYYPANGFRGGLRRVIADMICDSIAVTEGTISGELYNGLHCGASSSSPDQTAKSIEEIIRARSHVYMGLFGGGARTHESMYAASDMLPILNATISAGMVPARYRDGYVSQIVGKDGVVRHIEPYELIDARHFVRIDDLYRVMDPVGINKTVTSPVEAVTSHQEAIGIHRAQDEEILKNEGKKHPRDVSQLQSVQTIAAGTPMFFRIDMKSDATEAQAGALLLGIAGLLTQNNFGCMGRWGFGRVKPLDISMNFGGELTGGLFENNAEFSMPENMARYVDQARKEIAAIRTADIAAFFEDFSADKKAAKKAAKAAQ